ncbi:hypothetical protein [Spiroplasma tabanidicola]|uniref:Uncharacterized protein n=1 Tax=Spiroplasma tabanidicola TaxID=324079 RepID=A0A6I6C9Q1_9MOLU|nr:hypothetical protein [Spiroplasma tabanidicola]QGS51655.1 hypothetical protein STABA_v1c02890 [Spiroplasma tabanidicola]
MKKFDLKDKVLIKSGEDYYKLKDEFEKLEQEFEKKVYSSMMDETKRIQMIIKKAVIKAPVDEVFKAFVKLALKDLNPNIDINEIEEGCFGITSKKSSNQTFRVDTYEIDEEFTIKYFGKNNAYIRSILFKGVKNKTKIKYTDTNISKETIFGLKLNYLKGVYQKSRKFSFAIQVINLKLLVEILDETKKNKYKEKIKELTKKLIKYQE